MLTQGQMQAPCHSGHNYLLCHLVQLMHDKLGSIQMYTSYKQHVLLPNQEQKVSVYFKQAIKISTTVWNTLSCPQVCVCVLLAKADSISFPPWPQNTAARVPLNKWGPTQSMWILKNDAACKFLLNPQTQTLKHHKCYCVFLFLLTLAVFTKAELCIMWIAYCSCRT